MSILALVPDIDAACALPRRAACELIFDAVLDEVAGLALDDFTRAYIECALWAETDNSDESGGRPLDLSYHGDDVAPEALRQMAADCRAFQRQHAELLARAYAFDDPPPMPGYYDASSAGHDFWLTRNGHGAGFWDRGLGDIGDELTEACEPYGACDLYVEDGQIFIM